MDAHLLSYEVHTNRELEFMLTRGKPLAHFSDAYLSSADEDVNEEIIPELAFAPYVHSGKFTTREFVVPESQVPREGHQHVRGIRHVFYALSGEAWRIDAYIMMMFAAAKSGWSEGFERLEGSLLGYEEWQTDMHVERLRANPPNGWGWVQKP